MFLKNNIVVMETFSNQVYVCRFQCCDSKKKSLILDSFQKVTLCVCLNGKDIIIILDCNSGVSDTRPTHISVLSVSFLPDLLPGLLFYILNIRTTTTTTESWHAAKLSNNL